MTLLQSIILGIVQGLTEFLPISSSAHLVLVPYWFNWNIPADQVFSFDVLVQLGTLLAVIIYFWKDLWQIIRAWVQALLHKTPFATQEARLGWYLILASIPAALAGVTIKDLVESAFGSPVATAIFLFITALLLVLAEWLGKRQRTLTEFTWLDALIMGIGQAVALFPGVSRSGATIAAGMFRHLDRPAAARFSFIMSIPVMLGAGLLSALNLKDIQNLGSFLPTLLAGFLAAAVVGYLSIHWLLRLLQRHSLYVFAFYCVLVGALTLGLSAIRTNQNQASDVAPTTVTVAYTPTVAWLLPTLDVCARQQPSLGIVANEVPADNLFQSTADVWLRWGEPSDLSLPASVLTVDQLVFVIHPTRPQPSLTIDDLASMLTQSSSNDIVWRYSPGNETEEILFGALSNVSKPAGDANLALTPELMRQGVASNSRSIGYLPARWLDGTVQPIGSITGWTAVDIPVLAITTTTPQASLADLLKCMTGALSSN